MTTLVFGVRFNANLGSYLMYIRFRQFVNDFLMVLLSSRFLMKDCNVVKWASWPPTTRLPVCTSYQCKISKHTNNIRSLTTWDSWVFNLHIVTHNDCLPPQHCTELTWKGMSFTAICASHWHATVVLLVPTAWSQPMQCKLDMCTTEAK